MEITLGLMIFFFFSVVFVKYGNARRCLSLPDFYVVVVSMKWAVSAYAEAEEISCATFFFVCFKTSRDFCTHKSVNGNLGCCCLMINLEKLKIL